MRHLTAHRFAHSHSVALLAEKIAHHYGWNSHQAYCAGLLHDCARDMTEEALQPLLRQYRGPHADGAIRKNPKLWHDPVGVVIARRDYQVTDPFILRAIGCHTTGRPGMRPLDKIVFVADFGEPLRKFKESTIVKHKAFKDLDDAVKWALIYKAQHLQRLKKEIHPRSIALGKELHVQLAKG